MDGREVEGTTSCYRVDLLCWIEHHELLPTILLTWFRVIRSVATRSGAEGVQISGLLVRFKNE